MIIVEYKIPYITALYLKGDVLPPADIRSMILCAECCFFLAVVIKKRCKLIKDTEAKATALTKNKFGFNLLNGRVMKYLVLVDFLCLVILSDKV